MSKLNQKRFIIWGLLLVISIFMLSQLLGKSSDYSTDRKFIVGAITDNDHQSRDPEKFLWRTTLQNVVITFDSQSGKYELELGEKKIFETDHNRKNRSMEISALQHYHGKLYGFCDYTGFMFELPPDSNKAIPVLFLPSGSGSGVSLPFKNEWVTLKDGKLIAGSIGKEWVVGSGETVHSHCEWVKEISHTSGSSGNGCWSIRHVNWHDRYMNLREYLGYTPPGYIIHEAIVWDENVRKWVVMPRKVCKTMYNEREDQNMGTNLLVLADENFEKFEKFELGPLEPQWGWSALVKLQGDHYAGIKASEATDLPGETSIRDITGDVEGFEFVTAGKMVVFDLQGRILSDWLFLGKEKFEGVELLQVLDSD